MRSSPNVNIDTIAAAYADRIAYRLAYRHAFTNAVAHTVTIAFELTNTVRYCIPEQDAVTDADGSRAPLALSIERPASPHNLIDCPLFSRTLR